MAWSTSRSQGAAPPGPPALLPNELARSSNGRVELRTEPLRVRWALSDLVTADGHKLRGAFMCSVRAVNEPAERKVLAEVFLSRKATANADDVVAHFAPTIQIAAANTAGTKNVADWLADESKEAMADVLRKAADKVAFNSGLELLPPFQVDVESPSFQQQKLEQLERNLSEQRVAGQVEHFERAAALLKQFDTLRQAAPGITPGAVLQQISPSEQGMMLQTLLLAAGKGKQMQSLWGVAGPFLLKIDPRASPPKIEPITLPADLGPLRSVEPSEIDGERVLLVGARDGVMVVRPEAPTEPKPYRDPDVVSQMGFSKSMIWRHELWACHGDAGVVAWDLAGPDHPKLVVRPTHLTGGPAAPPPLMTSGVSMEQARPGSPRNLTKLDERRALFSVNERLFTVKADGQVTPLSTSERADVVSIQADAHAVYVIREDGSVFSHDPATLGVTSEERRGGRINSAGPLPWLASSRLLLVSDDGPIHCLGTDDQLVTQYLSSHRGLRMVTAAADVVAAISADRQRLVVWNSWDGRKPVADVSVAAVAKHRVADVHFG